MITGEDQANTIAEPTTVEETTSEASETNIPTEESPVEERTPENPVAADHLDAHEQPSESAQQKTLKAAARTRAGVTVAILVVAIGVVLALFRWVAAITPYRLHATIGLAVLSVILYFFRAKIDEENYTEAEVLRFGRNPGYWGFVIVVSATMAYCIYPLLFVEKKTPPQATIAKRKEEPKPKPAPKQVEEPEPAPVVEVPEFPALHASGVILNGRKSTVVIDKVTVAQGEMVKGCKVVEICNTEVVVELKGFRKSIPLSFVD